MLRDGTIVCLSSIDWGFNWQIPQEVTSRFAREGNHVLFIENTGVRRPAWRDASRLRTRLGNWWRAGGRVRPIADRLDLCSPVILPFPYSRLACRFNSEVLLRVVRRWVGERTGHPVIFMTFLPTLLARAIASGLDPSLVIYYCADRLPESSPGARHLLGPERALLADADVVFTSSSGLLNTASEYAQRAVLLTSGVRFHDFQRAREGAAGPPTGLRGLRRPIVGYVGSVRNELDLALLARVARLAPELTFVFVGPIVADVTQLAACPNVRLLGPVAHADAVRYMLGFDLGLLPYVVNPYTTYMKPVKLKEYLAAGLPVVSTNLPEIRRFVAEHGSVVTIADGADAFAGALRSAVACDGPAAVARRLEVARRYDWANQMRSMSAVIEAALAGDTMPARLVGSAS